MFDNGADQWEEALKIGIKILKKGERNNTNHYSKE